MKLYLAVACLASIAGCASGSAIVRRTPEASKTEAAIVRPADSNAPCDPTLTLAPDARRGTIRVRLESPGPCRARWRFPGSIEALEQKDLPWQVRYEVRPGSSSRGCPFEVTPDRAVFCGEAVIPLPEGEDLPRRTHLVLAADGTFHRSAASSFGVDPPSGRLSFDDIARAVFVFGDLGLARFRVPEGRDHAAWLGSFSFDPRWVAAEAAGVRTAVDRWFGLSRHEDPSVGMLLVSRSAQGRDVLVRSVLRGVLIEADVTAPWSARARLDVARRFVQRVIGPGLSVQDAEGPGARAWFEEGVAHAIGLNVLAEAGILTPDEIAAEVSTWLAEDVISALRDQPLAELAQALDGSFETGKHDARRLLAVRGALVGLSLGPGLRRTLSGALREGRSHVSMDDLFPRGRSGRSLREAFVSGAVIPFQAEPLGPCLVTVRRPVAPFDLGFTPEGPDAAVPFRIGSVKAGSAAARVGLRSGDLVLSLDVAAGRASSAARITVERAGRSLVFEYLPRGTPRTGYVVLALRGCGFG